MPDELRIHQLLEDVLVSKRAPEDVCLDDPELLLEVRHRLDQIRGVERELDGIFPPPDLTNLDHADLLMREGQSLPPLDGHDVEGVLGRGGMGVVYRARHRALNRPVAVKMLLAGAYASPRELARFREEAEAVAGLRHPNIVQVYDAGDVEGRLFFTMELVEGGSLARQLAGTPQPVRRAAELVAILAGAVQFAHRSGIVHRDLKPANILLTAEGTPKISDFGLARRLDGGGGLTQSGTAVGTPSYMAPEQARGQTRSIGPAVDVYALGAILYELLTGRPPFRAETAAETVHQVVYQEPLPPARMNARVPRDLETICLQCLQKEPRRRYATAVALAEDLHRFLQGEAVAARPEGRLERLVRRVRQRPILSAALAAGTLVTAALVGGGLWLLAERAAAAREVKAERAATERAAEEDLREMLQWLKKSSWPEARAALERAKGRLGDRGSAELRRLLEQGTRDSELAARLEVIRMDHARGVRVSLLGRLDEYEQAFREAGLGQVHDDPEVVAGRVRASNIRDAILAALDHVSSYCMPSSHASWALNVARRADPDPTGWRDRARDPVIRADEAALVRVIETAPVRDQSVSLLLALEKSLKADSHRLPFLIRIQQAHPGDFWANRRLGDVLRFKDPGQAIRYYQAAVSIRPRMALGYHDLGMVLAMAGRTEEAVEPFRRAVELDPTPGHSLRMLVVLLSRLGRHDEAINHLRVAIRRNPDEASLHTALGQGLEVEGRHAEALAEHQQAVTLDPKSTESQRELRTFLMRRGRLDEMRVVWKRAIEANPLISRLLIWVCRAVLISRPGG